MESRWYFFSDQNAENTKISDRAHALHITNSAWNNITKHLDRKKLIQEALDKDAAHKKALKEGSDGMTREWADSIENIRKRQQEEREKRLGLKQQVDKFEEFNKLKEGQKKLREEIVKKIETDMFRNRNDCLDLTTALRRSEAIYEREKQLELRDHIRNHEMEEEAKFSQEIIESDQNYIKDRDEKARLAFEKRKAIDLEIKREYERVIAEKEKQKKEELEKEIRDRELAEQEMKEIEANMLQEKLEKKLALKKEKQKGLAEAEERKRKALKAEKDLEQIGTLYRDTKHKIACVKKQKEKEIMDSYAKRSEAASKHIEKEKLEREQNDEERYKRALEEVTALELKKLEEKNKQAEKRAKEIKEHREQYLEQTENNKKLERETKKWEMLNRFKQNEVQQEHDKNVTNEFKGKMKQYQQELLEQIVEQEERRNAEKEESIEAEKMRLNAVKEEDDKFFEYANEVLDTLKNKEGRTLYPVEQVILRYKKENDLLPRNEANRKCKCHCNPFKPFSTKKKWETEKNKSLEEAGFRKCKCCKKLYKNHDTNNDC